MTDIADLKPLLDAIIAGNDDQARVTFHTYLTSKLQAAIASAGPVKEAITPGQMRAAQDRWETNPDDREPEEGDPFYRVEGAREEFYRLIRLVRDADEARFLTQDFEAMLRRFNNFSPPRDEYEQEEIDKFANRIEREVTNLETTLRDQGVKTEEEETTQMVPKRPHKVITDSGWYTIDGDVVTANNSGYKTKFSRQVIKQVLATGGKLTDLSGDPDWQLDKEASWGPVFVLVLGGDLEHHFYVKDFQ